MEQEINLLLGRLISSSGTGEFVRSILFNKHNRFNYYEIAESIIKYFPDMETEVRNIYKKYE